MEDSIKPAVATEMVQNVAPLTHKSKLMTLIFAGTLLVGIVNELYGILRILFNPFLAIENFITGTILIISAFGIMKMHTWSLYLFVAFIVIESLYKSLPVMQLYQTLPVGDQRLSFAIPALLLVTGAKIAITIFIWIIFQRNRSHQ